MVKFLEREEIKEKITELLRHGGWAIVAYIGANARNIIHKNTIVLCNFDSNGTNPSEVKFLLDQGIDVRKVPTLHAKVYCSEYGAVIGSANLSTNGLELLENVPSNLIETAIYITPDEKNTYQDIKIWCEKMGKEFKKGNIKRSEIESRIKDWKRESPVYRRLSAKLNYEELKNNVLIAPILEPSDLIGREDLFKDDENNTLRKYVDLGYSWIECTVNPYKKNVSVQPIHEKMDGRFIFFVDVEKNKNNIVSNLMLYNEKPDSGLFVFERPVYFNGKIKKKEQTRLVYLYRRVSLQHKTSLKKMMAEAITILKGKTPVWLDQPDREKNLWGHFQFEDFVKTKKSKLR